MTRWLAEWRDAHIPKPCFTARSPRALHCARRDGAIVAMPALRIVCVAGMLSSMGTGTIAGQAVPVTIGGTLEHPTVFVDIAAASRRALENEIRRRARDFLGGLFKKKK